MNELTGRENPSATPEVEELSDLELEEVAGGVSYSVSISVGN